MANPAAEQQLLAVAETIERALDDELDRMDQMDENDLATIRRNRIKQLKEMAKRKEAWLAKGHGVYQEITDPKKFFEFAKGSERVIVHFGRGASERCNIADYHMKQAAPVHFETMFARVDVEKIPSLAEQFNVYMLPTLMLIEGGNTFHSIIGFDEFGGNDDFTHDTFQKVLMHYGMVNDKDMFAADQTNEDDS